MSRRDEIVESVLCGVLPGENQKDFGVETLGLAAAGMNPLAWAALRWRTGDVTAWYELCPALTDEALNYPTEAVRRRASLLARLVLVEEACPPLVGKLNQQTIAEAFLMCSVSWYARKLKAAHKELRARADAWAREGWGHIAARIRG